MGRVYYDHGAIIQMRKDGYSIRQIAQAVGGREDTIGKILRASGMRTYTETDKNSFPIYPEDIQNFRKRLQIGDTLYLEEWDPLTGHGKDVARYHVVAKYPWFCIARNARGRERSVLYVELIIRGRGRK